MPGLLFHFPLDCACGGGARGGDARGGGKLVGEVSLSEKVVLVLLDVEAGVVKEGSGFLPSRRVLSHDITVCAIKARTIKACAIKACAIKCVPSRRMPSKWILGRAVKVAAGS